MLIWFRAVVRGSLDESDGHDIAFEEESIERGRRVKVGSILDAWRKGQELAVEVTSSRKTRLYRFKG